MAADKHWLEPPKWWKKVKPLRWLAIGGIIFVIVSATYTAKVLIAPGEHAETAKFTEMATDPVPFLDSFKSYQSVDEARALVDAAKIPASATASHPPANSKYPPRDRDTLVANGYLHLGFKGQLTLEFFNDRLYQANFVPEEVGPYADKLHAADKRLKKENNRIEFVEGNLRIASNVDLAATTVGQTLQTKPYVIWQDSRLTSRLDEWDRRFVISATPK